MRKWWIFVVLALAAGVVALYFLYGNSSGSDEKDKQPDTPRASRGAPPASALRLKLADLMHKGKYREAVGVGLSFLQANPASPENPMIIRDIAKSYQMLGQWEDVKNILQTHVSLYGADESVLEMLGTAHYYLKDYKVAKPLVQKGADSGKADAAYMLARILLNEGNKKKGAEYLSRYIKKRPGDLESRKLLIDTYGDMQQWDLAVGILPKFNESAPHDFNYHQWLLLEGFINLKVRKAEVAEGKLLKYYAAYPGDSTGLFYLACAYSLKNDQDNSLIYLEKAFQAGFRNLALLRVEELAYTVKDPRFFEISGKYFSLDEILGPGHSSDNGGHPQGPGKKQGSETE